MSFALHYESKNGKIIMTPKSEYQVMNMTGLEQVIAEPQVKRFAGVPGQKTIQKTPEPRNILITGRIRAIERRFYTDKLIKVFDNTMDGVLKLDMFGKLRRIECIPESVIIGEVDRNKKVNFAISLICDNPYFKDWADTETQIFSRVNNLFDGMTFPRVFSYLSTKANLVNNGYIDVEPIIIVEVGEPSASEVKGLLLENETTGKELLLNYEPDNEIITFNIPTRKIISSKNGDITRYKPLQYLLSDFVLKQGSNVINLTNYDANQLTSAKAIFSIRYTEAIY